MYNWLIITMLATYILAEQLLCLMELGVNDDNGHTVAYTFPVNKCADAFDVLRYMLEIIT